MGRFLKKFKGEVKMIFSCQNPFGGEIKGEAYFEEVESPKINGKPIRENGIGYLCVKSDMAIEEYEKLLKWILNYREFTRDPNINQFQYGTLKDGIAQELITQCNPIELNTIKKDDKLSVTVKLDWKNRLGLDEDGKLKI